MRVSSRRRIANYTRRRRSRYEKQNRYLVNEESGRSLGPSAPRKYKMNSLFKANKDLEKDEERVEKNWRRIATYVGVGLLVFLLSGAWFAGVIKIEWPKGTPSAAPANSDLRIKGNKNSRIYHLPNCKNYNDISPQNIEWFKTEEEAAAAGFRKAGNCP